MQLTARQLDKFYTKVEKTDACWNWVGAKTTKGYGRLFLNYRNELAHRVMYMFQNSVTLDRTPGASGQVLMHTCDNPSCVNPKHLKLGTQKDNMLDAKLKGRKYGEELLGENNPNYRGGKSLCSTCGISLNYRWHKETSRDCRSCWKTSLNTNK